MARYRIVHWREIPSLVEVFDGERVVRTLLSQRFQDLIDAVAMRRGVSDSEAYLDGWGQTVDVEHPGGVDEVAGEVAAKLETEFQDLVARHLTASSG
jgi:hypothetical protein